MTIQEKISKLDDAIVKIESYLSYSKENGESVKKIATDALQKIGAKNSSIQAVKCVSFADDRGQCLIGGLLSSMDVRDESSRVAYRTSVQAIVNILKHERDRLIKEQSDAEQKKGYEAQIANNTMQQQSLKWSKIAAWAGVVSAFIGLASIAFSIFLYLCKN